MSVPSIEKSPRSVMLRGLILTAVFLCGIMNMRSQSKIVVLSDLHLMAPGLLVNDGTAWQDFLAGDRKLIDFSQPLLDEMVERLKTDIKPELVLITGDLTKDGETVSHQYVIKKLDELKTVGIKSLVIPGNHDLNMGSSAVSYDGDKKTVVASPTLDEFVKLYADYGYGQAVDLESSSKTYVCEPISGLQVIGINSGKNGTLSAATLDWVCEKALTATMGGKKVLVMMHHALIPHITNAGIFVNTTVINDYDNIRKRLIDAGVKVILTGHFHTSDIAKDFSDDLKTEIFDIATGALVSYPCDYRELNFSADLSKLDVTTGHITSTAGNAKFNPDSVKTRLHGSIKKVAYNRGITKVKEKLGDVGLELFKGNVSDMADMVGQAFVIHAEGDEHKVKTESILNILADDLINIMIPGSKTMFLSMLKDLSPYGVAGRENQTDDLTLTIDMGAPVVTSQGTLTIDDDVCEQHYDLNGRLLQNTHTKGLSIYKGKIRTSK